LQMNDQIFKISRQIFKMNPFSRLAILRIFVHDPSMTEQISSYWDDESNIVHYNNKGNLIEIILQPHASDLDQIRGSILFADIEDRPTIGVYFHFDLPKIKGKKNTHKFGIIDSRTPGQQTIGSADDVLNWGNMQLMPQVCYNFQIQSYDTTLTAYVGQSILPIVNVQDLKYPVTVQVYTGGITGTIGGGATSSKSKILTFAGWSKINKMFPIKVKQYELLYRGSRDGFDSNFFHAKCDGFGPTLTVIKNSFGKTFGGYSPVSWDSSSGWTAGTVDFFIFHLDENLKFPWFQNYSIHRSASYGPTFGQGHEIYINQRPSATEGSYVQMNSTSYRIENKLTNAQFAGTNSNNWRVVEIEVFAIKYV